MMSNTAPEVDFRRALDSATLSRLAEDVPSVLAYADTSRTAVIAALNHLADLVKEAALEGREHSPDDLYNRFAHKAVMDGWVEGNQNAFTTWLGHERTRLYSPLLVGEQVQVIEHRPSMAQLDVGEYVTVTRGTLDSSPIVVVKDDSGIEWSVYRWSIRARYPSDFPIIPDSLEASSPQEMILLRRWAYDGIKDVTESPVDLVNLSRYKEKLVTERCFPLVSTLGDETVFLRTVIMWKRSRLDVSGLEAPTPSPAAERPETPAWTPPTQAEWDVMQRALADHRTFRHDCYTDMQRASEILIAAAEHNSFCSVYDQVVEEANDAMSRLSFEHREREYEVEVEWTATVTGTSTYTVQATSSDQAEEMASEGFDVSDYIRHDGSVDDTTIDSVNADVA